MPSDKENSNNNRNVSSSLMFSTIRRSRTTCMIPHELIHVYIIKAGLAGVDQGIVFTNNTIDRPLDTTRKQ